MNRLLNLPLPLVAGGLGLLLFLLLLIPTAYSRLGLSQAQGLVVLGEAPAFALTDHLERPVNSEELRGKIVVADFIYTNCKDICPLLSAWMKALQERLRQEKLLGSQVQLLSFTVDPTRDTPTVLRAYAERYKADPSAWRFLTGPEEEVAPLIVDGFHLGVEALPPPTASAHEHDSSQDYEVMHSGRFVLMDRQGRIRAYYLGQDFNLERVMGDIQKLVAE